MKTAQIFSILALGLASVGAQAYNFELDAGVGRVSFSGVGDDVTTYGLAGTYYLSDVKTAKHALSSQVAPFLNKINNVTVGAGKIEFFGVKANSIHARGEFWVPDSEFYVSAHADRVSAEGEHVSGYGAELGLTPIHGLLLAAGLDGNSDDTNPQVRAKYVGVNGANEYVLESQYVLSEGDDSLSVSGTYFFTRTLGAHAGVTFVGSENVFTVGAENFFSDTIAGNITYSSADDIDSLNIGASLRF